MSHPTSWNVLANTAPSPVMHASVLEVNGRAVSNPPYFMLNHTAYIPIYDVQKLVNQLLHIQPLDNRWDGKTHTWSLTSVPNLSPLAPLASGGTTSIVVNGVSVDQRIPTFIELDPVSHHKTTFMPVSVASQLLNGLLGILPKDNVWDAGGKTALWSIRLPDAMTKVQVVTAFITALDVPLDVSGQYDFSDVSNTDPDWPYVITAVNRGYVNPDTMTEFGASDTVTEADLDSIYWNFIGIKRADGAPGGEPTAWADIIEVNRGLSGGTVLPVQFSQFMANLQAEQQGWWVQQGVYHLLLPPRDDYQAYVTEYPNSALQSSGFQSIMAGMYEDFDQISIHMDSKRTMVMALPVQPKYQYQAVFDQRTPVQVSTDGGATWTEKSVFKTDRHAHDVRPVLIKVNANIPLTLIVSTLPGAPQGAEISLTVQLEWADGKLRVTRRP